MDMDKNKETFELGSVPMKLALEGCPGLNHFSLNVLFMKFETENGKLIMGSALYEPDFLSLKKEGDEWSLKYHNIYGGDCWLIIKYNEVEKSYVGEKFINGKSVVMACGFEWKMFFFHFTVPGIANGEKCKFEEVKN